jgi:aerobic-type carbon monoxide dehydrogenase small subunit (CoxS/CutS family)
LPTADHFTGRLNLSPRRQKTGDKYIGNQIRRTGNPATQALRMSAQFIGTKSRGAVSKGGSAVVMTEVGSARTGCVSVMRVWVGSLVTTLSLVSEKPESICRRIRLLWQG